MSIKTDLAAKIHRGIYGKCDKANSPDNSNPDFKAGYTAGMDSPRKSSGLDLLTPEWERRGCPEQDTAEFEKFREWKRGFYAARMQRTCAEP